MDLSFEDILTPAPKENTPNPNVQENRKKFLDFIGESEGADYNTLVGGKTFDDFSKHPNVVGLTTEEGPSRAAGKYMITHTTYKGQAPKLGITDFSPESQDKIALKLIEDKNALADVDSGNFETAIDKLGGVWASFPSSPYKQPKRSKEWVQSRLSSGKPEVKLEEVVPQPSVQVAAKELSFDDILNSNEPDTKPQELSFDDILGTTKKPTKQEPTFLGTLKESLSSLGGDKVSDKSLSDLIVDSSTKTKPNELSFDDILEPSKYGKTETFFSHLAAGVPKAIGGHIAGTALVGATEPLAVGLAPVTGGHSLWAVPLASTLVGYGAGSYGTGKVERNLLPENVNKFLDESEQQNPLTALSGEIGSFRSIFKFGFPQTWKEAALLSGIGTGVEGFNQYQEGKFDPAKLGISIVGMNIFGGKQTKLADISTLKNLRNKKSTEVPEDVIKEFTSSNIYVPPKVDDIEVVNVTKEPSATYAERHGITEDTVASHKDEQHTMEGPVRMHTDATGTKRIEVDTDKIADNFTNKTWVNEYNLDKDFFKTPQAYTDYLISRHIVQDEMPISKWYQDNPSPEVRESFDSRKSYYEELNTLEALKAADELTPENITRLKELQEQGAPKPVIRDPANLNALELKSVLYGSKNLGEALDRLVNGKFGGEEVQSLIKVLQRNKFLTSSDFYISEKPHVENVPGEYRHGETSHELTLYPGATPRIFVHESLHAGTSKALNDPANSAIRTKFEDLLADLRSLAQKSDIWDPVTKKGHYGLSDVYEMISEAFTNREFQAWLKDHKVRIDSKPVNAFEGFKNLVKDILGIKDKSTVSAFDDIIDLTNELTHQDNKYGRWDREPTNENFDYLGHSNKEYEDYVHTAALELSEANPFYNVDNLNIPPVPKTANDLEDFLYTLDRGRSVDDIRLGIAYDNLNITQEQKDALRLFTEGLHKDHVYLNSKALENDKIIDSIQKTIRDDYKQWEFDHPFEDPKYDKEFMRSVALRYERIESIKEDSNELRKIANQRIELTPEEQKIYDEVYLPLLKIRKEGLEYLMKEGVIPTIDLTGNNFPRKLVPMNEEQQRKLEEIYLKRGIDLPETGILASIKDTIKDLAGGDQGGYNVDMQRRRAATQERSLFVLERGSGKREVIQVTKSGNIIRWENINGEKVPTLITRKVNADGSRVTPSGQVKIGDELLGGKVIDGTMQEIEYNSPYTYNKDSLAVLINAVNDVRDQVRQYEGLKQLTQSPLFKEMAIPPNQEMPEGYRVPMYIDKIPALRGYAFPNKTAEVIEDFARNISDGLLTNLSGIIVKNMMMNPLPHMFNEGMHLYNSRGLTGWVTPAGIYRFVKYTRLAIDDVLGQSKFYTDTMKLGGALLAPGTRHSPLQEALIKKGISEFSKTPDFKQLALALGRSFKEMYNGLSKTANRAMWISRDIMYMSYLRELMATRGFSHAESIKYGEKHLPNYRLPSRVGEQILGAKLSRSLSWVLQNPNISVFSRYHYGYLKSMIETVKEAGALRKGKAGKEEFLHGVDSVAAIAVALALLYPMVDVLVQNASGNPEAKQRRAGPYHFINAVTEVAHGSKKPRAIMDAVFTINPALVGLYELGYDSQLYNNQEIYSQFSDPAIIAKDVSRFFLGQLPMAGQSMRAEADVSGEGWDQFMARQFDIESPSMSVQAKKAQLERRLRIKAKKHDIKRGEDLF